MAVRTRVGATAALVVLAGLIGAARASPVGDDVPPPTTTTAPTTTTVPAPTTTLPTDRPIGPDAFAPMASVGDLVILHPTGRVERVGWHESSLDGALELTAPPTAVAPVTLNTRDRGHGPRTAADVVSDPDGEVRAPVSGTVVQAGAYQLYCSTHDDTVVIRPDGHPTWLVRILHIDGIRVVPGWHVTAGQSVIAARPRQLPFPSQVDKRATVSPSWPHVHVEVDDDTVPDRPSDGDSCPEPSQSAR